MQANSQQQQQQQSQNAPQQAAKTVAKTQTDTQSASLCPKCSTEIPEGANFCPECGEPLTEEAIAQTQAEAIAQTQAEVIEEEPEVIEEEPVRKSLLSDRQFAKIMQAGADIAEEKRLAEERRREAERQAAQQAAEAQRIAAEQRQKAAAAQQAAAQQAEAERQRQIREEQAQKEALQKKLEQDRIAADNAAAIAKSVQRQAIQDPMLGTYVHTKYGKHTIVFDSPTHAIEIAVRKQRPDVTIEREFSVTVKGNNVTLNETANNYGSLPSSLYSEWVIPLSEVFKGSFNGKKTVLKGYWHHSDGHTSSHFVYDKV